MHRVAEEEFSDALDDVERRLLLEAKSRACAPQRSVSAGSITSSLSARAYRVRHRSSAMIRSLMFTVAGMVPFVPYLFGPRARTLPSRDERAEVHSHERHRRGGQDSSRHLLFRCAAIFRSATTSKRARSAWPGPAYHERGRGRLLGFSADDLWVTVYEEDDEAFGLWREIAGLSEERIQRSVKTRTTGRPASRTQAHSCSEIFDRAILAYAVKGLCDR